MTIFALLYKLPPNLSGERAGSALFTSSVVLTVLAQRAVAADAGRLPRVFSVAFGQARLR